MTLNKYFVHALLSKCILDGHSLADMSMAGLLNPKWSVDVEEHTLRAKMSLKEVVSLAQPPKTSMAGFPGMTDAHTFSLDWQVRYKRLMCLLPRLFVSLDNPKCVVRFFTSNETPQYLILLYFRRFSKDLRSRYKKMSIKPEAEQILTYNKSSPNRVGARGIKVPWEGVFTV